MEEKHKDLKNTRQKQVLDRLMAELASEHPSFYYLPTVEIAVELERLIAEPGRLSHDDAQLMQGLDHRDIQILLSLH
ncbi:MAG: hypothetical protein HKN50_01455 [Gammaproteobacteria bacterium]|nr:hypothetical protein [Gammaproteobacteria bacterium]